MKATFFLSSLAFAPAALAANFAGQAIHSGSEIHLQGVEARGGSVWVGGQTQTFCPDVVKPNCPKGKSAAFIASPKGGMMKMFTEVPGGQQAYTDSQGWLRYTQAHSADIPEGSKTGGFTYSPPAKTHPKYGYLTRNGKQFFACPVEGGYRVNSKKVDDQCIEFKWLAYPTNDLHRDGAWQYE